jgi:membrane protease YdiL (CAAX protease family)
MKNILTDLKKFGKSLLMLFIYIIVIPGISYAFLIDSNFKGFSFLKQNLLMLACEGIVFIIVVFIFRKTLITDFKDFKTNFKSYIKIIIKYFLIGIGIMILTNFIINYIVSPGSIALNEVANRESIIKYPIYSIMTLIILGPISEELIFRANFKNSIKNEKLFLVITALLFGSMHLLAYFDSMQSIASSWEQLLYLIPYTALGFIFGYVYLKTKNIYSAIMVHLLTNLLSLSIILLSL